MMCLVSDRRRLSAGPDALDRLVDLVGAAARAGVDLIQIRERDLEARALLSLVSRCLAAIGGTRAKLLVNDRADVAVAARAHGVHLRGDSIPVAAARSLLDARATVGRSIHSVDESGAIARAGGVDYLTFGTLYQTASKHVEHPVASLDDLSSACRAATGVPVLAIGGITVERAAEVARTGAAGVAGIGLFIPPAGTPADRHLRSVADALRRAFDTCEAVP